MVGNWFCSSLCFLVMVTDIIKKHKKEFLGKLMDFCRFPVWEGCQDDNVGMCVKWIVGELENAGFFVKTYPTAHKPIIYAEKKGTSDKTILFYNHYDVVPIGNRNDWESDPFDPTFKDGRIYGRGLSDHKSSFLARLYAVSCLEEAGALPVNVKFLLEGDEEYNSPELYPFVETHASILHADGCLYPGWRRNEKGMPRINCGSRGNFTADIVCRTADHDLHELNAALVPNALTRVMQAVSSLFDEKQNVKIQGFYDKVRQSSLLEKTSNAIPFDAEAFRKMTGCRWFAGGISDDQAMLRSTLTPVISCYGVESSSTARDVVPCEARAHLRFYTVPDQNAEELLNGLANHLKVSGFSDCEVISDSFEIKPSYTDIELPFVKAVQESAKQTYGIDPIVVPISSGTGPKYVFTELLSMPVVSDVGVGDSLSNAHAANESIVEENYYKNIEHVARIMQIMAKE